MPTMPLTWADITSYLDIDTNVYDDAGNAWRRTCTDGSWHKMLYRWDGDELLHWTPQDDDVVSIDPPGVPEPPDGTRIEFEHHTDVYAAWRDDASSAQAGWPTGDGGDVWCLYGESVPIKWAVMWLMFGDSLRTAVRLTPAAEDVANYAKWPTAVRAAAADRMWSHTEGVEP